MIETKCEGLIFLLSRFIFPRCCPYLPNNINRLSSKFILLRGLRGCFANLFGEPMKFCCGKKGSKPQNKSFQEESKRGKGGKEKIFILLLLLLLLLVLELLFSNEKINKRRERKRRN